MSIQAGMNQQELAPHASQPLRIERGLCHVSFAYDAARFIDLNEAERRIHKNSGRQTMQHRRRTPSYFEYKPPPLRVRNPCDTIGVGPLSTSSNVDLLLYDFGAVTASYTAALEGSFDDLLGLSEALYDNPFLLADSRKRVDDLLKVLGDAATHANVAPVVEDYVIFQIETLSEPLEVSRFLTEYRRQIAQILRAERRPLSNQEVEDAFAAVLSYGTEDVVVVDWNAALLLDREGEDVREVLQFANVELLEMRYLEQKLDSSLDRAYEVLSERRRGLRGRLGRHRAAVRTIAELQVDSATMFEGVNNALKLVGDQYLARVYRLVSLRFHLDGWDASILRKLQTLESIYQKMSDEAVNRRMEVLEWVIIILFVFSIILELLHFQGS
jgi:hypothetical protein